MDDVAMLFAIEQIKKVKAKYLRGVDFKDLQLLREVFANDVHFDAVGGTTDPETGINAMPVSTARARDGIEDVMGAFAAGLATMGASVHFAHIPEIEILDENNAKGIWSVFDMLRFPAGTVAEFTGYGHYHETYVRIDGEWKINSLRLTRLRIDTKPRA